MTFTDWKAVEGFFSCSANPVAHFHPGRHDDSHTMSKPSRNNPLERYCLGRGCEYMERRSFE